MSIDAPYLTPPVVTSQPQFQNTFLSNSHSVSHTLLIPILKHLDVNAIVLGKAREAHLIHKVKTIEPLGMNKRDESIIIIMYLNIYLFFGLFFFAATRHHVITCNFRLLFYSSMYPVNSWFFSINLMKTGIGQSK